MHDCLRWLRELHCGVQPVGQAIRLKSIGRRELPGWDGSSFCSFRVGLMPWKEAAHMSLRPQMHLPDIGCNRRRVVPVGLNYERSNSDPAQRGTEPGRSIRYIPWKLAIRYRRVIKGGSMTISACYPCS